MLLMVTFIKTAAWFRRRRQAVTWMVRVPEKRDRCRHGQLCHDPQRPGRHTGVTASAAPAPPGRDRVHRASGSGTLGLNLSSAGSIQDTAGNALTVPPVTRPVLHDRPHGTDGDLDQPRLGDADERGLALVDGHLQRERQRRCVGQFRARCRRPDGHAGDHERQRRRHDVTVTESTGGGSGTLGLNLTSAGSIQDTAGNALARTPRDRPGLHDRPHGTDGDLD